MNNDEPQNINRISLIAKAQGAFLGAAVGDAMGWSQEPEARRVDKNTFSTAQVLENGFQKWVRKSGGQYYPYQEIILPGEYSDDTQLILCTARSLLYGKHWCHHFTKRELPTWTCYERGGGGATKRAANEWLNGKEPWSSSKTNKKYFDAGGNGVAMRILPHCLLDTTESNFAKIAKNIVANGVTTHGHPRALVGALAYGFALWVAFRETKTLEYGAIIEKLLSEVNSWSYLPDLNDICPTWKSYALEVSGGKYGDLWQNTVNEMLQLLKQCREAINQGALAVDRELLIKIGGVDKKIKGAGTVTAAAAIFLASRYAADPLHGVVEAAFTEGADTDTIASMTGAILGAIAGIEWLGNYAEQVQDARYLRRLAEHIAQNQGDCQTKQADNSRNLKISINWFIEEIAKSNLGKIVRIPDEREAQISTINHHQSLSKSTVAISWKLTTTDGQSLYIKKLSRPKNISEQQIELPLNPIVEQQKEIEFQPVEVVNTGVKLPVRDIKKSRFFYEKVLGIKVKKETEFVVRCGCIVLVPLDDKKNRVQTSESLNPKITNTICIEIASIEKAYNNVCQFGAKILQEIFQKRGRPYFTCLDPDGNIVEIYQEEF
jgi:ADP-ribosylglycohydrolase/predicted enzyme related to lactoylglutathione lyase